MAAPPANKPDLRARNDGTVKSISLSARSWSKLVLAAGLAFIAHPVSAETLADAVAAAYARNPSLNEQRFRQKANDEGYVQARAAYGPQLNGQISAGKSRITVGGLAVQDQETNTATLSLNQPLYSSGRLRGSLAAARANVLAGQEQLRATEQQLVQNVISVYAAVLRDEARLAVGRENVTVLQDQLRENIARRRVGDVTLTDVGQADSRLAAAELQLASLEASLAVSRGQYLQVVGHNPGTLAPLPDIGPMPTSIDDAFVRAEDNNPDLSVARLIEQVSSAEAASVRGERGFSISVAGQASYSNDLLHIDGRSARKTLTGQVTLSQPLFNSGAIQSRVREADARNSADQVGIDQARRAAMQAVTLAWSQLSAARVALVAGQRQVESAQLAFAGMQREQRNGLRSTIDTLNAEQELQAAQLNFLQSRYSEYVARGSLLAAVGTLRAKTIASDVEVYDPEENFRRVRHAGMTPLEPIAMGLDRIGSAAVRRPLSANLTGEGAPRPDQAPALPEKPGAALTEQPLVPINQSRVVPASELPGGLPRTGALPDRPATPPDAVR